MTLADSPPEKVIKTGALRSINAPFLFTIFTNMTDVLLSA
jgi:hypothetical protein